MVRISSPSKATSKFKQQEAILPYLITKKSSKITQDSAIVKNMQANVQALLDAKEAKYQSSRLEHLKLKRKIKSISKDTTKFSIERGGQVDDQSSRSSSRGSRKNFFDRQLIKERNEIGPNLR